MDLFTRKCDAHNTILRGLETCPKCIDSARAAAVALAGPPVSHNKLHPLGRDEAALLPEPLFQEPPTLSGPWPGVWTRWTQDPALDSLRTSYLAMQDACTHEWNDYGNQCELCSVTKYDLEVKKTNALGGQLKRTIATPTPTRLPLGT